MVASGPIPKPTYLKILEGVPGHRPLPKGEPKYDKVSTVPVAPEYFDDRRRTVWNEVCAELITVGCLTSADLKVLERYCDFFIIWREMRDFAQKRGASEWLDQMPYISQLRNISNLLLKIEEHFGFTPASRTRINTGLTGGKDKEPEEDPFD